MRQPGLLLAGFYAWTVTVAFGALVIDIVYASELPGDSAAFAEAFVGLVLAARAKPAPGLPASPSG